MFCDILIYKEVIIMPSTLTHSLFSMQVFDQLDEKIKNKLKNYKEYIKVFANGPDPLNFYFLDF